MSALGNEFGLVWGLPQIIFLFVAAQRVIELGIAKHNAAHLLSEGGTELGAGHYPLFVLLHGGWLLALFLLVPASGPVFPWLLGAFCLLQLGRLWVIASLGRYWTTRVITLPNVPLIRRGPYRYFRHPNYLIVTLEIAVLPLAFGAWELALIFSTLNAALLSLRLKVENAALAPRQELAGSGD